ncbi:carbohydrate ABC transporter permease [Mangrovactinospora gilvigrisea]|uniref:carbohydrate ABC transporter permease n=1 Tax=Mangrovactinospora gilvigrisea TaxID=1428644 RepID=UPI0009A0FD9E|nr:carbohydrate ABC transporter permease [Mangrovactinospora gilvigrisea]
MASTAPVAMRRLDSKTGGPLRVKADWRSRAFTQLSWTVLVLFGLIWIFPAFWSLDTSLRPEGEIAAHPAAFWSSHWTFGAYGTVWKNADMLGLYVNSFLISTLSVVFTVAVCSMAGFAIARIRFRGYRLVTGIALAGLLIPPQIGILPMFREVQSMHLLNTYWSNILPGIAAPVAVFVFASFFRGLPHEMAESARVDGAGWFRIYWQVYLPLCRPAVAAVSIFTFIWSWNSFLWPLLTLSSPKVMTIPVGLNSIQTGFGLIQGQIMAGAVLGALPLVFVFLFFQRHIVEGVANTGIK